MYDIIRPIPSELKLKYALEWAKWSKSESDLRIIDENKRIIEVNEEYFDEYILSKCSNEYTMSARVIGNCIGHSDQLIGDTFYLKRVIHLVQNNQLVACHNDEFIDDIELSSKNDENAIIINGINMTYMRFFCIKLEEKTNTDL